MSSRIPPKLQGLFRRIENCRRCRSARNPLRHIFGGGKFHHPKFFFLFINPTHKNLSSHRGYSGKRRFPFIGVRHFWKELSDAGIISKTLVSSIYQNGWQPEDEERIEKNLRTKNIYLSNFVKCAAPNPKNPSRAIMREALPLLAEEFRIVNPRYIVTFGALPLSVLTNTTPRLRDILASLKKNAYEPMTSIPLHGRTYPVLPSYFLLGHGNPPRAKAILRHIQATF